MKKVLLLMVLILSACQKEEYQISTYTYKTVDEQEIKLDVYEPEDLFEVRPVAVYIHGGSFVIGSRQAIRSGVKEEILRHMLEMGYVVVSIDYRLLTDEVKFPSNIEDVADSVGYLVENATDLKIDPNHIGIWGASAGGHLALYTAYNSDYDFDWVIDIYGVSDFQTMPTVNIERMFGENAEEVNVQNLYSPIEYVNENSPETLILHGTADKMVPIQQSYDLKEKLEEFDVPVTLLEYEGFVHGLLGLTKEDNEEILEEVENMLKRHY